MDFNLRVLDKFTIVDFPDGDLNFVEATALKIKLKDLVKQGHVNIVVNLRKVDFIDSTAIGTLITIHKNCIAHGGEFRICCLNNEIEMVLYLTGVDSFLNIYYSEHEAVTEPMKSSSKKFA